MASKSFPLLKLPILPIAEILRNMGLIEAFIFTRVSGRAKRIVKAYFKPRGFELAIDVHNSVTLRYTKENELDSRIMISKPVRDELDSHQPMDITDSMESWYSNNDEDEILLSTESDDLLVGLKKMYAELTEIFTAPIKCAAVWMDKIEKDYKSLIHWLDNSVLECPKIFIYGEDCAFGDCMWTLENIKSIKNVVFNAEPKDYTETIPFRIDAGDLLITHGRWAKPAHLTLMEAEKMYIRNVNLTNEEITEVLAKLKNGSNSKLDFMILDLNRQISRFDAFRLGFIYETNSGGSLYDVHFGRYDEDNTEYTRISITSPTFGKR